MRHEMRVTPTYRTVLITLLCCALVSGCSIGVGEAYSARYNARPHVSIIPEGLDKDAVRDAAIESLIGLHYEVLSANHDEVVGYLEHRGFKAKVILDIEVGRILVLSDSTYTNEEGVEDKAVPKGWVKNVKQRLDRELQVAAVKHGVSAKTAKGG